MADVTMVRTILFIEGGKRRETMMPLMPVGVFGKDHSMEVEGQTFVIDKVDRDYPNLCQKIFLAKRK